MQSENFDKKIRDSLSQRPPGSDNPAWDKMEVLLDKHMPVEKKDKRRFFFILFLFLFTGGGAFLIWQNNTGDKKNISAVEPENKNSEETGATTPDKNANNNITGNEKEPIPEKSTGNIVGQTNSKERKNQPANSLSNTSASPDLTSPNTLETKPTNGKKNNNPIVENNNSTEKINSYPEKDKKPAVIGELAKTEPNSLSADKNEQVKEESQPLITENKTSEQKPETKESQPVATEKSTAQKQANKRSFLNNLFFSVSAGPDFSAVGFDNAGQVQLGYGAGLGYRISDKFSIRTGFYAARKIYSADPEDYDPPYNVSQYYPNLKNIDANCKVYEIPITIDYTISKNKKQSWFVSGGLSSLIMKEETYEFYFKPNYSPTYVTYTKTIHNQNKHYFSVLNLSGGYTRNINQHISLQAEPYLKIALSGVGLGKVNLNSGGVLFSAIIKPFASKK